MVENNDLKLRQFYRECGCFLF
uniref:Uncharacterized protein n=1 Tax=Lepeophtheirus salmonis TaxID=72036 RepID=A0A0K2THM1_LEPSM